MTKKRVRPGHIASLCLAALAGALITSFAPAVQSKDEKTDVDIEGKVAHVLSRITFGAKPGQIEEVEEEGLESYLARQLHPEKIALSEEIEKLGKVEARAKDPVYLFLNYGRPALMALAKGNQNGSPREDEAVKKVIGEYQRKLYEESALTRIKRATESPQELKEVMTDFWFNHFNISQEKGLDHVWIGSYEERAIRPFVLGKFRDMLGATAHHSGMLFYLDNWQNTKDPGSSSPANELDGKKRGRFSGINENYARELMELHTLGVDGGYTQKDVQELARVLTGLGLPPGAGGGGNLKNSADITAMGMAGQAMLSKTGRDRLAEVGGAAQPERTRRRLVREYGPPPQIKGNRELGYYFDKNRHDFGDKVLLGQVIKGEGEAEIEKVLDLLARHPATARHISYKLAQYFVADSPPKSLVEKMSKRFLDSDGDIAATLDTLFHSSEFYEKKYRGAKFKSPYRYLLSSLRATNSKVEDPKLILGFLKQTGMPLYQCLTPDGYKNTKEAWLNPDNLLNRLNYATALGTGRCPGVKIGHTDPAMIADACTQDLSSRTIQAVKEAPQNLKAPLVLGSPEFMVY